ncbi:MAG: hypothetical protein AB1403_00045 [Candidatus Riflebacteria bacterium]
MIAFEAFSEHGLISYTGQVVGTEIVLNSYSQTTRETINFTLSKIR